MLTISLHLSFCSHYRPVSFPFLGRLWFGLVLAAGSLNLGPAAATGPGSPSARAKPVLDSNRPQLNADPAPSPLSCRIGSAYNLSGRQMAADSAGCEINGFVCECSCSEGSGE